MPMKRRTYKRTKRYNKKRSYGLTKVAKMQVAKIARSIDNKDKELKFTFYEFSSTITDTWLGPAAFISWPAQAVTAYTSYQDLGGSEAKRIGNEIDISHIQFNYRIDVADTTNVVRLVIFQWFQTGLTPNFPTVGDIMMNNGAGYPYIDMYNYVNKRNYRILYDKTHLFSADAGNPGTIVRHNKFYGKRIPIKRIKFVGDAQSGFAAQILKGGIYYMFVSDSTVPAHPSINMAVRLLYTDA